MPDKIAKATHCHQANEIRFVFHQIAGANKHVATKLPAKLHKPRRKKGIRSRGASGKINPPRPTSVNVAHASPTNTDTLSGDVLSSACGARLAKKGASNAIKRSPRYPAISAASNFFPPARNVRCRSIATTSISSLMIDGHEFQ